MITLLQIHFKSAPAKEYRKVNTILNTQKRTYCNYQPFEHQKAMKIQTKFPLHGNWTKINFQQLTAQLEL